MLCKLSLVFVLASSLLVALASPQCTLAGVGDVAKVRSCSVITIAPFTMPAKQTLILILARGTRIEQQGDITFEYKGPWNGPLMSIYGDEITYNGNGHTLQCQGEKYWDNLGTSGPPKPGPALSLLITGSVSNLILRNTPLNAIVVEANGKTILSKIFVDNRAGASKGHNTDGINVVGNTNDLTITGCVVVNQDDCIAITSGRGITITQNQCFGGHGISIGSIKSAEHVSGVLIARNHVEDSQQGYRIKTYYGATQGSVSDVTYSDNTGVRLTNYGVVIEQDYTDKGPKGPSGATSGVQISNVKFIGPPTILSVVNAKAPRVYVLCGVNSCIGNWDWSSLRVTGGAKTSITRAPIRGFIG